MDDPANQPPISGSISLLGIPSDVLQHHIFIQLDVCSLVACSLVCSQFRKLWSLAQLQLPTNKLDSILKEIYRNGYMGLMNWFQARLGYPSMWELIEHQPALLSVCISLAAKGLVIP